MKLLTFLYQGKKHAGVLVGAAVAPVEEINAKHGSRIPNDLLEIIRTGVPGIDPADVATLPLAEVTPQLPYETPPKIWCIGLNYLSHAEDINAVQPEEPGSFMKPASCMFQPGGNIVLPPKDISDDVDAEGELGVVIGKTCRFVPAADIGSVIFGYTTTLDLTALDILRKNPRYLTRSKSIDTFFSFGPVIVTADEVKDPYNLTLTCTIDRGGKRLFEGSVSTSRLHRKLETLVEYLLRANNVPAGSVLLTGTGIIVKEDAALAPGDTVSISAPEIGTLTNTAVVV